MNKDDKEVALNVNALLMSLHYGDDKAFDALIADTENPADLLMGSIGALKNFVDLLLRTLEENVDIMEVTFEDLVKMRGAYVVDLEEDD